MGDMMTFPLLIGGKEIHRSSFTIPSPFYPDYSFALSCASLLDASNAIGAARQAEAPGLAERSQCLLRSAEAFTYSPADLEHTVRMTGMPISQVREYFDQIPGILKDVPQAMKARFRRGNGEPTYDLEIVGTGLMRLRVPVEGFCYAITPGTDPRASAMVAANLGYLGIPFVLRTSPRDGAAGAVLRALWKGGYDPNFCSLLYLDRADPSSLQKHFKLVDASAVVWIYGPSKTTDPGLRYQSGGLQASLALKGLGLDGLEETELWQALEKLDLRSLLEHIQINPVKEDHFIGKMVLRHESGNCAAITSGPLDAEVRKILWSALAFPVSCTSTRAVMVVDGGDWVRQAADFLESLAAGDPLDPQTQVGYIEPSLLDRLHGILQANAGWVKSYGGLRLSDKQATPLLVLSQQDTPDFFAQEIPAYLLAARECATVEKAAVWINQDAGEGLRLAVSLIHLPEEAFAQTILALKTHTVMINRPTTALVPAYHEGNDYINQLTQGPMLFL